MVYRVLNDLGLGFRVAGVLGLRCRVQRIWSQAFWSYRPILG